MKTHSDCLSSRSPSSNRRLPSRGVSARTCLALAALLLCSCSDDAPAPSFVEPGEWLPGGDTTNTLLFGSNAFIRPAENILVEHEPSFYTGNSFFNQSWVQAPASTMVRDGLGPMFNARSCAACHFKDGRGEPPESPDDPFLGLLLRISVPGGAEHGAPAPVDQYGGQLQPFSLEDVPTEARPSVSYEPIEGSYADGTPYTLLQPVYTLYDPQYGPLPDDLQLSPRVAQHMVGLGLLEAIDEARLEELADPEDADGDGISGRLNRVWSEVDGALAPGRFGWKAEQPTVEQQVAGALLGDVGITSPVFMSGECAPGQDECAQAISGGSPEINQANFDKLVLYSSLLAVPARQDWESDEVLRGKELFMQAGCGSCHTPSHRTGSHDSFAELSDQLIWPYTDMLLHDMGPELSDERPSFQATGQEWRTPPLWSLRLISVVNKHERLLHDGRARGYAEAILWHGGEGEASREVFRNMPINDRQALLTFLDSL